MRVSRAFAVFAAVGLVGVACSDNGVTIPADLEVYTATLNGANEAPTAVTTTATGHATVTILGNVVTWKVVIDTPIDSIILGHIHRHAADSVAGNVQVNFAPPATGVGFKGTATQGSAVPVDSILGIIRAGRSYVNIHTKKNPAGEIRGTLVKL
ncbi:MAG: hypothetical protein DMD38_05305 [Gemmatimonadetes bacterium]|nr:MAG: hypothetical protein AUI09_06510 [Gemmatimonadetes bacterium 13_2_20CM_2_66_5]OLC89193.1 MAG: hypothetical protein AUI86_01620 [Gemmatimonadetes bacterium 13_1_40CM_3_66_12]OLD89556.1 MAG: hypothetical protein AUG85_01845 [Gemmatimonadetes bacterium 13_1_20CM_4_66_11]PYP97878.1 MAG: hypothetical protein DMD38_05305 [Gemmatimonadota bacterium]